MVEGGDFNGDGKRDLLWRKGTLYGIWLMDGAAPVATGMIASPDPGYLYADADPAVVGDFDGDGKSDVMWYRPGDGSAALSLMDGLATKESGTVFVPAGREWQPVSGADFNGDGKTDIVWTLHNNGAIGLWLMNGSAPPTYGVVSWGANGLAFRYARDMDGDGKADLVLEDASGGASVWLMDGLAVRQQIHLDPGPGWSLAGIGDYDGDGKADLLWTRWPEDAYAISTSLTAFTLIPLPPSGAGWVPWR